MISLVFLATVINYLDRQTLSVGFASMGAGFGGMVFTLITGWIVDHYSYTPVFIGFGILSLARQQ